MICVSVWAAGGELRPGVWSLLRDEAAHLRGRGQCQANIIGCEEHILLSGDDKRDPAAEPELPSDLQRGRHLCLPGQEAVGQHMPDQVRDILVLTLK